MKYLEQALAEKLVTPREIQSQLSIIKCSLFNNNYGLTLLREKFITMDRLQQKPFINVLVLDLICTRAGLIVLREGLLSLETINMLGANKAACILSENGINALRRGFINENTLTHLSLEQLITLRYESPRFFYRSEPFNIIDHFSPKEQYFAVQQQGYTPKQDCTPQQDYTPKQDYTPQQSYFSAGHLESFQRFTPLQNGSSEQSFGASFNCIEEQHFKPWNISLAKLPSSRLGFFSDSRNNKEKTDELFKTTNNKTQF